MRTRAGCIDEEADAVEVEVEAEEVEAEYGCDC